MNILNYISAKTLYNFCEGIDNQKQIMYHHECNKSFDYKQKYRINGWGES